MNKRFVLIVVTLAISLLWASTVFAAVQGPTASALPLQEAADAQPQGVGLLILLIGIAALLAVGFLTRRADQN